MKQAKNLQLQNTHNLLRNRLKAVLVSQLPNQRYRRRKTCIEKLEIHKSAVAVPAHADSGNESMYIKIYICADTC